MFVGGELGCGKNGVNVDDRRRIYSSRLMGLSDYNEELAPER